MLEILDDRTAAYILETRRPFEDLRQIVSQLAGLLVLAASGAKSAPPDRPLAEAARAVLTRAADEIRAAQPDARSSRHHRHLLEAVAAIDDALGAAAALPGGDWPAGVDAVLRPLKSGYAQLQAAATYLPGFELVALNRGCCFTAQVGQVSRVGHVEDGERPTREV